MQRFRWAFIGLFAGVAACSGGTGKAPTGQVVATVNGKEITLPELRAELGATPPNLTQEQRAQLEGSALQLMVVRQILADEAKKRNLDGTPLAAIFKQRAEVIALADLMQSQLRQNIPVPSREEAQIYVSDHPSTFARRTVYVVDQVVARDVSPALVKAMEPLNSMDQILSLLTSNNIAFSKTVGVIDTLTISPDSADRIAQLPPGSLFVSPEGPITRVNRIRESQQSPLTGEDAVKVAQSTLQAQRADELLQGQVGEIVKAGMGKVKFNAAYKAAAPAVPAPATAPAKK
jgi:EpsD family peptidyl-prolyl cis-trans isomerase